MAATSRQVTEAEAVSIYESGIWKEWSPMQLAAFQGSQARLCVPFAAFHAAADSVPGFDGIMTLGLALMAPTIATEAASRCEAPEVEATVARAKEMLAERARRAEARDE